MFKNFTLLIIFCTVIQAQISVTGKIVNSESNEPLSNANVFVVGTNYGTPSDNEGKFSLTGNFSTDDVLRISFIGFEAAELTVPQFNQLPGGIIKLTPKVLTSQSVLVSASIGKEGFSPITFSKIKKKEIQERYSVQDVPEFLSYLPNTTFYSESGNGIGYNYLSIRGFDQRRISISVNGIPQNDPEDHNIYWLDLPNLLGSTELIQVQRGAGSGVIGYPAVGGSINIITSAFSDNQKYDLGTVYGSYNTRKYTASFASGLIDNKYSLYAKFGKVLSSGYRHQSWVDFNSYHLSAVRYDENVTTQINLYGGPISDGLAYNGLAKFAIKDKELRKENLSYWESEQDDYTYKVYRRPDETENFSQPHFELLNEFKLSNNVTFNNALFLILGDGFFDYDGSWADSAYFRLTRDNGFVLDSNPENVLIRAMVENKQWGVIPRIRWTHTNGELTTGIEYRNHRSVHWGSLRYGENLPKGISQDYRYYYYEGGKDIFNFFVNENYELSEQLNIMAELQLAYHNYKIENERYLDNEFEIDNLFLNPRIGLNYKFTPTFNSYISFARVTREPRLKNYYDAAESSGGAVPQFEQNIDGSIDFTNPLVKPESMNNLEIGANYSEDKLNLSLNFYYMLFDDEIVKSGQLDRFGQPITGNIDKTVHTGIEFTGSIKFLKHFDLTLNGSVSKNYISSGNTYLKWRNQVTGEREVVELDLTENEIGGFPSTTFNAILRFYYSDFSIQLFGKYVGEYYSDNYGDKLNSYLQEYPGIIDYNDNLVESYFVANLITNYEFSIQPVFKKVKLFVQVNNIFDNLYAAHAVGKEFYPAAERNYLVGLTLGL
ncbi:thiamin-regulated outer membrane receptor omr1 [hydrocarbon metagenome]|uniref:Thiamin-regulated outer membrane receptor omr1 n=1 Tax=hydrocarbon metagenome TaxID=938273 RepID=A0A0W8FZ09_9ZZZZ